MNFDDTLNVCSYLSLCDLYNILNSDVNVFDKSAVSKAMNKKKNNMSDYEKFNFFQENPEVAIKLFNFRSLCNKIFKCIKTSEFISFISSDRYRCGIADQYNFDEPSPRYYYRYYNILSDIIRRFPGLVSHIDDKVFGNRYFIRDFTIWKRRDGFIYDKTMKYIKNNYRDIYEDLNMSECDYNSNYESDTDDEQYEYEEYINNDSESDASDFGDSDDEVEYEDV